jgi:hypothetical protein
MAVLAFLAERCESADRDPAIPVLNRRNSLEMLRVDASPHTT